MSAALRTTCLLNSRTTELPADGWSADTDVEPVAQRAGGPAPDPAAPPTEPDGSPDNEAAKHWLARRAAEAERDALAARVHTMQTAEVARLAGEHLAVGADLFAIGGAALPDLLVDGEAHTDAVRAAVGQLPEAHQGLARPAPLPDLGQATGPDWAALLRGGE